MQVTRGEASGPVPVLRLEGDFDAFEADDLRKELAAIMTDKAPSVILDLGDMTFANSTTIACFISAQNRATELGGRIALAAPREFFRKTLTTLGLERVFSIHDDVAAAESELGK
ncbi:MAG: STAS domain-containing protein [Planctomycetota bacterium]